MILIKGIEMRIGVLVITLRAPWVHSLKEKRMEVKSLTTKIRNKFNVSISEVDCHDIHQTIVLGVSFVATDGKGIDKIYEAVMSFIEGNSEAFLVDIEKEMY